MEDSYSYNVYNPFPYWLGQYCEKCKCPDRERIHLSFQRRTDMKELQCKCGGTLVKQDGFYCCEYCRSKWVLDKDDEGFTFLYNKIEKKDIETGKILPKASEIAQSVLTVKEIQLNEDAEKDIFKNTLDKTKEEALRVVVTYVETSQWDMAMGEIHQMLSQAPLCPEANWYQLWCEKKCDTIQAFSNSLYKSFTEADAIRIDKILSHSTPSFARRVIGSLMDKDASSDEIYERKLSTVIPFLRNEQLYTSEQFRSMVEKAFGSAVKRKYCRSFDYLLGHTLESYEVDRYIAYLMEFAGVCEGTMARTYYQKVLAVDKGNLEANRKLVRVDLTCDISIEEIIADLETLLACVPDTDQEVRSLVSHIVSQKTTTIAQSEFLMKLLGYHPQAPECFEKEILAYARVLLSCSLFDEAISWCHLVLSFNKRQRDAWWLISLAKIRAKNENPATIASCQTPISECVEFNKLLSLCEDEATRKKYAAFQQRQNERKKLWKKIKIGACLIAAIICLSTLVSSISNSIRYSVKNIDITVTDKTYGINSISIGLENKSPLAIEYFEGIIEFYNADDERLVSTSVTYNGYIAAKTTQHFTLSVDTESEEFRCARLADLRGVFKLETARYENGVTKQYDEKPSEILSLSLNDKGKSQTKSNYEQAEALYEQGEYSKALALFDKLGQYRKSAEYSQKCRTAIKQIKNEETYQKAIAACNAGRYDEAIRTFRSISDYKDSTAKISNILTTVKRNAAQKAAEGDYAQAQQLLVSVGYSSAKSSQNYLAILDAYQHAMNGYLAEAVRLGLTELVVPEGYNSIPKEYFSDTKLEKIVLPSSLSNLEEGVFKNCESLREVVFQGSLATIPASTFYMCKSLTEITLPKDLKTIEEYAFYECGSLKNIALPEHLEEIGEYAFWGCDSLAAIKAEELVVLGDYAFWDCISLEEAIVNGNMQKMGVGVFKGCTSLLHVTLPRELTEISSSTFENCSALQQIILPGKISTLGYGAFAGCNSLSSVTFESPSVWYRRSYKIIYFDVSDPAQNAKLLSSTHADHQWFREE